MKTKFIAPLLLLLLGACSGAKKDAVVSGSGGVDLEKINDVDSAVDAIERDLEASPGSTLHMVDRVHFEFKKKNISSGAEEKLKKQAEWLKQNNSVKVLINGHCDERGTQKYNMMLGNQRAHAAKAVLMKNGINAKRISTKSMGKDHPVVLGSGEEVWAQNRVAITQDRNGSHMSFGDAATAAFHSRGIVDNVAHNHQQKEVPTDSAAPSAQKEEECLE